MRRLLWFGFYSPRFTRTRIIMDALREKGIDFDECRVDPRASGKRKYVELRRAAKEFRKRQYDMVVVAFPGFNAVWMAKLLFRAPVVFDACYSVYQAEVEDRRTCRKGSLRAAALLATDWLAVTLADVVSLEKEKSFLAGGGKVIVPYGSDIRTFG